MSENNHLLVVDDEELNRDMLSRRLRNHGFLVDTVCDGPSALAYLSAHPPDLVLLDQMMPGMTGLEVLKQLRATSAPDQLPVIMVTALKDSERVVEALTMGANDYITKPVDMPVALARISAQLARKAAESVLRKSEERYALAARGANDGLWDWDLKTGRMYFSIRWKAILGYVEGEIGENPEEWLSRVHPGDAEEIRERLRAEQAGGAGVSFEFEHRMRHRDGQYRWVRCRGAVVLDHGGRPARMAGSMTDITAAKVYDPLTGLPNRIRFMERVEHEFAAHQANPEEAFAIFLLDIDRFKVINDSLGHQAGDQLLVAVGERLARGMRTNATSPKLSQDLVARLGGDEFGILVRGLAGQAQAVDVARRILTQLREPFGLGDQGIVCTVSIGIAPCAPHYLSAGELVRDADTAMYSAKNKGRSRCEVFQEGMRAQAVTRLEMENDLRRALDNQEISVQYQPKVRLSDRRICGFEALARWTHAEKGPIPPSVFIAVAEETGLIHRLDMWVLQRACLQMHEWAGRYACDPPLAVSVNLSPRQFAEPDLAGQIGKVVRESGLSPACLRLEVTEGVLLDDSKQALEILTRIKQMGIGLKIDDFGTGYSSLAYLAHLPFDTLKIDRSFTIQLGGGECNTDIVRAILEMAHSLGMEVVAEGVEEGHQITTLVSMGCEYGQGFFFSPPIRADEAEVLVAATAERDRLHGPAAAVVFSEPGAERLGPVLE